MQSTYWPYKIPLLSNVPESSKWQMTVVRPQYNSGKTMLSPPYNNIHILPHNTPRIAGLLYKDGLQINTRTLPLQSISSAKFIPTTSRKLDTTRWRILPPMNCTQTTTEQRPYTLLQEPEVLLQNIATTIEVLSQPLCRMPSTGQLTKFIILHDIRPSCKASSPGFFNYLLAAHGTSQQNWAVLSAIRNKTR